MPDLPECREYLVKYEKCFEAALPISKPPPFPEIEAAPVDEGLWEVDIVAPKPAREPQPFDGVKASLSDVPLAALIIALAFVVAWLLTQPLRSDKN